MREHGGNLDQAMARFGGGPGNWLDLSTGINPRPYPLPAIPAAAWATLPTRADMTALEAVARQAYGTDAAVVPLAGAQAAIQLVPHLGAASTARVLSPTYNEHAGALQQAGWQVAGCDALDDLRGADIAVVVNPNNPDGRRSAPAQLLELARDVGLLVVDESFADVAPELSLAGRLTPETGSIVVLRSFGKFFGLAGLRLGFALTGTALADALRALAGPWPVSGPAISVGRHALADADWQAKTRARLEADAARLDALATTAGWRLVGGTGLFRTYDTGDAARVQEVLARARIWSRAFSYAPAWLRLGLPDGEEAWARLETVLRGV